MAIQPAAKAFTVHLQEIWLRRPPELHVLRYDNVDIRVTETVDEHRPTDQMRRRLHMFRIHYRCCELARALVIGEQRLS